MDSFDAGFKVARTCGILANILIGLGMIFLVSLSCTVVRKTTLRVGGSMLILGGVLEGLTFIIFTSDELCDTCEVFFGSGLALMCSLVTILNGIITFRIEEVVMFEESDEEGFGQQYDEEDMMKPGASTSSSDGDDNSDDSANYNHRIQIQEYNGRRQIVKTIVNQDGSRMLEETTVVGEPGLGGDEF